MVRTAIAHLAVSLTLFFSPLASASPPGEIPRIVQNDSSGGQPLFVRLDALLSASGAIDPSLVPEHDARTIRSYLRLPEEDGCVRLRNSITFGSHSGHFQNVNEAVRGAKVIFRGIVGAQAPGFSGSDAGTLLEVLPEETLKGEGVKQRAYYVFFPLGRFQLKGKTFCAVSPDFPSLPEAGDQVLLFVRNPVYLARTFFPLLDATDVVVLKKDAKVDLPRHFRADPRAQETMRDDLLNVVRLQVEKDRQR